VTSIMMKSISSSGLFQQRMTYCCGDGKTIPIVPSGSGPVTATWGNMTLTSPTIYAFFSTMQHSDGCGILHRNVLVPLEHSDIVSFSQSADLEEGVMKTDFSLFNWADMAYNTINGNSSYPLIPHSVYRRREECIYRYLNTQLNSSGGYCDTIYPDYKPTIAFKIANKYLTKIYPAYKYCGYITGTAMLIHPLF
jgi:hypothetical protein